MLTDRFCALSLAASHKRSEKEQHQSETISRKSARIVQLHVTPVHFPKIRFANDDADETTADAAITERWNDKHKLRNTGWSGTEASSQRSSGSCHLLGYEPCNSHPLS